MPASYELFRYTLLTKVSRQDAALLAEESDSRQRCFVPGATAGSHGYGEHSGRGKSISVHYIRCPLLFCSQAGIETHV